jgi:hypothetical protein
MEIKVRGTFIILQFKLLFVSYTSIFLQATDINIFEILIKAVL